MAGVVVVPTLVLLAACGQTGALYLPDDQGATVITRPGPAAGAAPPADAAPLPSGTPSSGTPPIVPAPVVPEPVEPPADDDATSPARRRSTPPGT
jgi:predicted small lipoprotein YifL